MGLCKQCDLRLFGQAKPGDFARLPEDRRDVFCYNCGPTKVDAHGYCISKCRDGHNWTWFDRLKNKLGMEI